MDELACEVLVIGAGLGGHAAALTAATVGADVILVEKTDAPGGSTVLSGGSFAFAGTDLQREQGIEDSAELLFEDLMEVGQHKSDPDLVRRYAADNLDAYRWLTEYGVVFGAVQAASGQSVPRSHPADPRTVIEILHAAVRRSAGIRVLTGHPVRRLTQDAEAVTGALATGEGREVVLKASRGVVLTCGGFSQDKDMLTAFAPGQEAALRLGASGNVGDGIRMAWKLGAGVRDMPYVKGTFGNHPAARTGEHTACLAIYKGAIAVDGQGRRFADESLDYKLLGDACLGQQDALAFQIFDQPVMDQSIPGYPIFDFERRLSEGRLSTAPTLAGLASLIGVPAAQLEQTVESYNTLVREGGEDPYGRRHLTHRFGDLVALENPPFYAYPSTSAVVATYAGVTVNDGAEVLDVFGQRIPRLFAAGEVVGGFHGAAYMTGTSLGKATVFGRVAGAAAARGIGATTHA